MPAAARQSGWSLAARFGQQLPHVHRVHAGRADCLDAQIRVFVSAAELRGHPDAAGGLQENVRRRFLARHILVGHNRPEQVPDAEVMLSGDLIEYHSAYYCGDAYLRDWPATLNEILAFNPKAIAPGRGDALKGVATVRDAVAMTRDFVTTLYGAAETSVARGRTLKESM